ncbi:MAG: helicase-exonuclease AddAB subunit AddA, partial [Oscillospiraceae bacterium]|nr:helicase-exonuclease AddAB subunit AddA [Oscillospiraceae bacterium]
MKFEFTTEQGAAIGHRGCALLVAAAAGSGKTKVLVERLLARIEEGAGINEFLVITYTRAAAAELRERIYEEILERLSENPSSRRLRKQSMLCRGAPIGTIHSFCTEILRENAHTAGLPPDFRVADESECDMIKAEVLEETLNQAYEEGLTGPGAEDGAATAFAELVELVSPGRDDKRLAGMVLDIYSRLQSDSDPRNWIMEQKKALSLDDVTDISQTVWGMYLMEKARSTAVFWLAEMSKLAEAAKDTPFEEKYGASVVETTSGLESFCSALGRGWDEARRSSGIAFPRAVALKGYEDFKDIRSRCKDAMKKCAAIFENSSDELIEDMQAIAPSMRALLDLVLDFGAAYSAEKRRRGLVDFSDLEHLTLAMLYDTQTGQKTGLAKSISKRYTEIMVDEYQDVNAVQELIFKAVSQDDKNIFMVGDVKQSIYRFRLADPTIFLKKYRQFNDVLSAAEPLGEANAYGDKIMLSQNFRSRAGILEAANFVFEKIMSVEFGEMDYSKSERLVPGRVDAGEELGGTAVEMQLIDMSGTEADDEEESPAKTQIEAAYIARRIEELTNGEHFITDGKGGKRQILCSDIVILLRSISGKAWQYARALTERGIAVELPGGEGFFETAEISAALSLLTVIDNPMQDIPLAAAMSCPVFGFSACELAKIRTGSPKMDFYGALSRYADGREVMPPGAFEAGLREKCANFLSEIEAMRLLMPDMPADRFIWHVYNKTGLLEIFGAMRAGAKRRDNLLLLAQSAHSFENNGYKGLFGFLSYIRGLQERGAEPVRDGAASGGALVPAVQIMSIHKSKGLEFPVVFLADTSKRFNNKDALQPLVLHTGLGLGPMRTDMERRIQYPTIARQAVQAKLTSEMMAEELRVLYVAMTRAREKLIITAAFQDAEKELNKFVSLGNQASQSGRVAPQLLEEIRSMAGWLITAHASDAIGNEKIDLAIAVASQAEANTGELAAKAEGGEIPPEAKEKPIVSSQPDDFAYPYAVAQDLPSKLTVTGLKGLQQDLEAAVLYPEQESEPEPEQEKKPLAQA